MSLQNVHYSRLGTCILPRAISVFCATESAREIHCHVMIEKLGNFRISTRDNLKPVFSFQKADIYPGDSFIAFYALLKTFWQLILDILYADVILCDIIFILKVCVSGFRKRILMVYIVPA